MCWRTVADWVPAGQGNDSPYDQEASFGDKRSTTRTRSQVHGTQTCEPGLVHLITDVQTGRRARPARRPGPLPLPGSLELDSASRNSPTVSVATGTRFATVWETLS
jgi:hypothetical protein